MGLIEFVKAAGALIAGATQADEAPPAEAVKAEIEKHELGVEGLDVSVVGDVVTLSGVAPSQEAKEKAVLAAGNLQGVAKVEDAIRTEDAAEAAAFHTVESGDTLWAIAQKHYGEGAKYARIFEANQPMLTHPDKIYPGQTLRIPKIS